jgi:hypothetical protein
VFHTILAVTGQTGSEPNSSGAGAIKRYARCIGGFPVAIGSVLGMVLAMVEADHFWTANVILSGLVFGEMTSAGAEIAIYRRGS